MSEILVGLFVGVVTNVVTHYLLKYITVGETIPDKAGSNLKAWLKTIVWGILPMAFPLFALVFIRERWPLTMLGKSLLLVISFVIAVGIVAGMRYISLHKSTEHILVALLIGGVLGGTSGFFLLDQLLPNFIAMDCPNEVKNMTTLQGRIIEPDWRIYLILRPRQGGAFVHAVPPAGEDGTWYATCPFGGGPGTVFEISALALSPDSVRALDSRLTQRPQEYQQRLEALASYKTSICVVAKE